MMSLLSSCLDIMFVPRERLAAFLLEAEVLADDVVVRVDEVDER
jgi:hypothetical protein